MPKERDPPGSCKPTKRHPRKARGPLLSAIVPVGVTAAAAAILARAMARRLTSSETGAKPAPAGQKFRQGVDYVPGTLPPLGPSARSIVNRIDATTPLVSAEQLATLKTGPGAANLKVEDRGKPALDVGDPGKPGIGAILNEDRQDASSSRKGERGAHPELLGGLIDLQELLGAAEAASVERISIYLPDKDKEGRTVTELDDWIEAAMTIMAQVNGGATCLPPATGIWRSDEGVNVKERTTIVYSFIRDASQFIANADRLKTFLHSFGKDTGQSEVMVEFAGEKERGFVSRAYFIRDYRAAT